MRGLIVLVNILFENFVDLKTKERIIWIPDYIDKGVLSLINGLLGIPGKDVRTDRCTQHVPTVRKK